MKKVLYADLLHVCMVGFSSDILTLKLIFFLKKSMMELMLNTLYEVFKFIQSV